MSFKIKDKFGNIIKIGEYSGDFSQVGWNLSDFISLGSEVAPSPETIEVINFRYSFIQSTLEFFKDFKIKTWSNWKTGFNNLVERNIIGDFKIGIKLGSNVDDSGDTYYYFSGAEYIGNLSDGNICGVTPGGIEFTEHQTNTYRHTYSHFVQPSLQYPEYTDIPLMFFAVKQGQKPGSITEAALFFTVSQREEPLIPKFINMNAALPNAQQYFQLIIDWLNNSELIEGEPPSTPPTDTPGSFDDTSDPIILPDIDDINLSTAVSSGLVKAYLMSTSELSTLNSKLWSQSFYDTILKNQNSPIENIQKVHFLPINVATAGTSNVKIGNYDAEFTASIITKQFQDYDLGEILIDEYFGQALDYDTDLSIFLPFIGERKISYSELALSKIKLTYRIDIVTGNCVANILVKRNRDNTALQSVLFSFDGNLSNEIPMSQAINRSLTKITEAGLNFASNYKNVGAGLNLGMTIGNTITGGSELSIKRTGNLTASSGYLGVLTPYIILRRPINVKPTGYDDYYSYPSFYTEKIANLNGLTKIDKIISDIPKNIAATDWSNILSSLQSGFYVNKYKNIMSDKKYVSMSGLSEKTVNGITFKLNDDNSISLSGTSTVGFNFYLLRYFDELEIGEYTFGHCSDLSNLFFIRVRITNNDGTYTDVNLTDATSRSFYFDETKMEIALIIGISRNQTINTTIYPTLEKGCILHDFYPNRTTTLSLDDFI